MTLDHETCYRALAARDVRFDGLFVVGVTSTGIYCRPVCTARTPGRERCRFFEFAATAERQGFRPCLRCRPEQAPGQATVDAVASLARRAASRIEGGALAEGAPIEQLAVDLGISSRQLRRAVRQEFGVSPIELAQTNRLLLAKQLLAESELPMIDVAQASGFASVRRFNALFRQRYGISPTQVRRQRAIRDTADAFHLTLAYRPPLAWHELLRFLAARATVGVERVTTTGYARTVAIAGQVGWLQVEPAPRGHALQVEVSTSLLGVLPAVLAKLRHLFDLQARPEMIEEHLRYDGLLARSMSRHPGLRVPGAFGGFELAVRAILGQQVSVPAATTLAGRLANRFGDSVTTPLSGLNRLTLEPAQLTEVKLADLVGLGILRSRAVSIRELARACAAGDLKLEPGENPEAVMARLTEMPGIGEWTAQYIAMRALQWPDAFPAGDLGLLRGTGETTAARLRRRAEGWRPWRAYAAMLVWTLGGTEQQHSTRRQR
ncbi:MAG: helix-turn-helix domain-containing protein [Planctomycetes bacterium]|nr:helix-turn-helix domain-containing protein [Planctomycetota bacterium]